MPDPALEGSRFFRRDRSSRCQPETNDEIAQQQICCTIGRGYAMMNSSSITVVLCVYLILFGTARLTRQAMFSREVESWCLFHPLIVSRVTIAIPSVEMLLALQGLVSMAFQQLKVVGLVALVALFASLLVGQAIVALHTHFLPGGYPNHSPPRLAEPAARTAALAALAAFALQSEV